MRAAAPVRSILPHHAAADGHASAFPGAPYDPRAIGALPARRFPSPEFPAVSSRLSRACLCLLLLSAVPAQAEPSVSPAVRRWIATVVTRIGEAGQSSTPARAGTVEIRLRVAADGSLRDVAIERGSGSAELDARILAAARAAAPFGPPPRALLTEDGTTELSFPVHLSSKR